MSSFLKMYWAGFLVQSCRIGSWLLCLPPSFFAYLYFYVSFYNGSVIDFVIWRRAIKAILIKGKKLWVQILVCGFCRKAHLVAKPDSESITVIGGKVGGLELFVQSCPCLLRLSKRQHPFHWYKCKTIAQDFMNHLLCHASGAYSAKWLPLPRLYTKLEGSERLRDSGLDRHRWESGSSVFWSWPFPWPGGTLRITSLASASLCPAFLRRHWTRV